MASAIVTGAGRQYIWFFGRDMDVYSVPCDPGWGATSRNCGPIPGSNLPSRGIGSKARFKSSATIPR